MSDNTNYTDESGLIWPSKGHHDFMCDAALRRLTRRMTAEKETKEEMSFRNDESANTNIAKALWAIARELRFLGWGDAWNREGFGAIESQTMRVCESIAESSEKLREEIEKQFVNLGSDVHSLGKSLVDAIEEGRK